MDEQTKLSRRSMLRGVALLAGGTLAAGVIQVKPAYAQKAGKEAVKYQDSPKDGQKCSDCLQAKGQHNCWNCNRIDARRSGGQIGDPRLAGSGCGL